MGTLIFACGGLCFMGLTIICWAYFVSRITEELNRESEKILENILKISTNGRAVIKRGTRI